MVRGGRGNRGGPAPSQNFNNNTRGFAPRGGRGGRGRGRGRGGGGGGGEPASGQQQPRRQDLVDEIMSQMDELDDEEFNFGISFKTLGGGGGPSRESGYSSSRGRGRGRGRGGGGSGASAGRAQYAYQDDTLLGAGRGATTRARGSGLGFGSPTAPAKIVIAGGGVRASSSATKDPWALPDYGRPLLRPVVFVRATLHRTLFEEVDEVIQAHEIVLEDTADVPNGAQSHPHHHHHPHDLALSHAPTADRVAAVFGIPESEPVTTSTDDDGDADESNVPATPKAAQATLPSAEAEIQRMEVQLDAKLSISEVDLSPAAGVAPSSSGETVQAVTEVVARLDISDIVDGPLAQPEPAPEPAIAVDSTPSAPTAEVQSSTTATADEVPFVIDTTPSTVAQDSAPIYNSVAAAPLGQAAPTASTSSDTKQPTEPEELAFIIDTTPSAISSQSSIIAHNTAHLAPLGQHVSVGDLLDDDEEIIVYDPLERSKPATPAPSSTPAPAPATPVTVDDVSFTRLDVRPAADDARTGRAGLARLQQLKERVTGRRAAKLKSQKRRQSFGMLGALLEETRVQAEARERAKHEATYGKGKGKGKARDHPVYGRGREAGSDLDWGTESEGEDGEEGGEDADVSARVQPDDSLASMDVDPELVDSPAFARFAKGLREPVHHTLDDFDDAERLRREDEDGEAESSSGEDEEDEEGAEVDATFELEVAGSPALSDEESDEVDGSDSDSDLDSDSDSDDEPFGEKLQRVRARTPKKVAGAAGHDAEESEEDSEVDGETKADGDESYLMNIQRMLELESKRKGKGKSKDPSFDAVLNGSFDYDEEENYFPERIKRKNKGKTFVDSALAQQWERDRQKKAAQKREREEARAQEVAAAMSPRHAKQLAKRFAKDNRNKGAATGEPMSLGAGRAPDLVVIEAEIRAFVRDLRREAFALPPLDKPARARVHLIAQNFGLKSKSSGKGEARFITLARTSRTRETAQNENKVRRLVHGGALKGGRAAPKHKEGDEVGKAAPKLTDTNLGYRLLQQMGWAEGDRIGLSTSGLEAPISAFFKTSKLGLGATR